MEKSEQVFEPIELDDAELAVVAGGITVAFGSFGGAQTANSTASGTNSNARASQTQ
jgi:hypothetical protein